MKKSQTPLSDHTPINEMISSRLKSVSKKSRKISINQQSSKVVQHQAIYNSTLSPNKLSSAPSGSTMVAPSKMIEGIKKQIDNIKKDNEKFT